MQKQVVQFVQHEARRVRFEEHEKFTLRSDRPAVWLQRLCFIVLRKLGAFSHGETITVERRIVDCDKFMDAILIQMRSIEEFFNRRAQRILIGAEDYAALMHEEMASFYYTGRREFLGMKVQVVPWMKGVLVMPAEDE